MGRRRLVGWSRSLGLMVTASHFGALNTYWHRTPFGCVLFYCRTLFVLIALRLTREHSAADGLTYDWLFSSGQHVIWTCIRNACRACPICADAIIRSVAVAWNSRSPARGTNSFWKVSLSCHLDLVFQLPGCHTLRPPPLRPFLFYGRCGSLIVDPERCNDREGWTGNLLLPDTALALPAPGSIVFSWWNSG